MDALHSLFVMSPQSDDPDGLYFLQDWVHEAVSNGDTTGIRLGKVPDQLFEGWRSLVSWR
jgi:hypothetical protein